MCLHRSHPARGRFQSAGVFDIGLQHFITCVRNSIAYVILSSHLAYVILSSRTYVVIIKKHVPSGYSYSRLYLSNTVV